MGSFVDIVIPVWNEGENIRAALDALRLSVQTPTRIFICYDRDDDTTLAALKTYDASWTDLVLLKNKYVGAHGAIRTGFEASTALAVVTFPADDTLNGRLIDPALKLCYAGAEIVSFSRFMPGGMMEGCPWLKSILVRSAAWTLHLFARLPTRDATNGLRLFSRRTIDQIPIESSLGFTYSLELLVKCHRLGWRIEEVPSIWIERKFNQSRFKVLGWLRPYLRWYIYAFATTVLAFGPETVRLRSAAALSPKVQAPIPPT